MSSGMSVALTSYALATVISFITAGLMALILKVVQRFSKKS